MNDVTICNNCAGTICLSLKAHVVRKGLKFCSEPCADHFFSPDNLEPEPIGLKRELGEE
jgi:hypothetical protein